MKSFTNKLLHIVVGLLILFFIITIYSYFNYKSYIPQARQQQQQAINNNQAINNIKQYQNMLKVYAYDDGRVFVYKRHEKDIKTSKHIDVVNEKDNELVAEYLVSMFNRREADCSHSRRFGHSEDGGWHVCLVGPFTPKNKCTVLSFGINYDYSFDDDISQRLSCNVYSFDPTMKNTSDYQRSKHVKFYKLGLYGEKLANYKVDGPQKFTVGKVDTLKNIISLIQLPEGHLIDVLKVDIELSEYSALKTAIADGSLQRVRQISMEMHNNAILPRSEAIAAIETLQNLYNGGFRLWKFNWNNLCNYKHAKYYRTGCHELYFININLLDEKFRRSDVETWLSYNRKSDKD